MEKFRRSARGLVLVLPLLGCNSHYLCLCGFEEALLAESLAFPKPGAHLHAQNCRLDQLLLPGREGTCTRLSHPLYYTVKPLIIKTFISVRLLFSILRFCMRQGRSFYVVRLQPWSVAA